MLVAPFLEALVEPHFEGQRGRAQREIVQDLSSRGLSFYTANRDLVSHADRIRAVTVECPDGLAATLGVSTAHVRPGPRDAPVRMAVEFEHARPPIRVLSALHRLADGLYAPRRRADAARLVRALLGADPEAAERRSSERIRVPFEEEIKVLLERGDAVVGEALLADVSPRGFGCYAAEGWSAAQPVDGVRLLSKGRELLRRGVEAVFTQPSVVRGSARTRIRVVLATGSTPWSLPLWAGAHEFGSVRITKGTSELVQAALLVRREIQIVEGTRPADLEAAVDLSYEAVLGEGDVDPAVCPKSLWTEEPPFLKTVLVARAGDLVVGTARLVYDGPHGLPYLAYCPAEAHPDPLPGRVEGGRLAVSRAYRQDVNARIGVAILLIAGAVDRCRAGGVERILIGVRESHERFYRALGFRRVSPRFLHRRFGVPTRMLELDVLDPGPLRRFLK